jgi:tetratricopeptide (TPR) repeat protein
MGIRTGIVIAVVLLLPAGVLAQAKAKAPSTAAQTKEKAEAKAHYDQGTVHFNLDEWPQAIEEFRAAYRAFPDAIFLYNIAQCHRKMGNGTEALSFYKKYLRERPDAPNQAEVEKRIDELETAKAAQDRARETAPPGVAQPALAPATGESAAPGSAGAQPAANPPGEPGPPPALGTAAPPPATADITPAGADVTASALANPRAASDSILYKWWFWTAVGVAVAAGGVGLAFALSGSQAPLHYQGDLTPPVVTVPR